MINRTTTKETDYLIIGAGAMGIAFADELFTNAPKIKLTIVDRRSRAGGHWNDAYPFVRLHQPAAFYGVNSKVLGNGSSDLSSKSELLEYYDQVIAKFKASNRVEFLTQHNYLGDGQVEDLQNPDNKSTYQVNQRIVDATYMKVEVPSTHAPKYIVDEGVSIIPINGLINQYDQWNHFYVIGNGKTGMDAVLYLLRQGISTNSIHWICPNQAWLFNRASLQVGMVAKEVLGHAEELTHVDNAQTVFEIMEKSGGISRVDPTSQPKKWRCATVSTEELNLLRSVKNVINKGRVKRITQEAIELQKGDVAYSGKVLFVDCSANGLSKETSTPIFSTGRITLQSVLFCQQVFSAATIAKLELTSISDTKRNRMQPVPHPEFVEDWPSSLDISIQNLLIAHRYFPMWMFRSRLNFMSHESMASYFRYAVKALWLKPRVKRAAQKLAKLQKA